MQGGRLNNPVGEARVVATRLSKDRIQAISIAVKKSLAMVIGNRKETEMSDESKKIIVCRCEDVTLEEIEKAIKERLLSAEWERAKAEPHKTCSANTLTKTGKPISEIKFLTTRPPIRPMPLALLTTAKKKKRSMALRLNSF